MKSLSISIFFVIFLLPYFATTIKGYSFVPGLECLSGAHHECTGYHPEIKITLPKEPYKCNFDLENSLFITKDNDIFLLQAPQVTFKNQNLLYYKSLLSTETDTQSLSTKRIIAQMDYLKEKRDSILEMVSFLCDDEDDDSRKNEDEVERINRLLSEAEIINQVINTEVCGGLLIAKCGYKLYWFFENNPKPENIINFIQHGIEIQKLDLEIVQMMILEYELFDRMKTDHELFIVKYKSWPDFKDRPQNINKE